MAVEQPSTPVGDCHESHLAAALVAPHGLLLRRFGNRFLCEQVAPAKIEPDEHLDPGEFPLAVGAGVAVIPYFVKVWRQGVLEKSPDELVARNGTGDRLFVSRWREAIAHVGVGDRHDSVVADRHAVDVGREVLQSGPSVTDRFYIDDPVLRPDFGCHIVDFIQQSVGVGGEFSDFPKVPIVGSFGLSAELQVLAHALAAPGVVFWE